MTSLDDEIALLERVFLRVGSADTDEQLESEIKKFLIPIIVKLSSTSENARNKIMELLGHINRRIKSSPNVQLPVETLLLHYNDPNASAFLVNFSIVYIKLGFSRLPLHKKIELVPLMLSATGRKQKMHQDSLLFLLVSIVSHLETAAQSENRREFFKIDENPELMKNFCSYMLDVLLLPYTQPRQLTDDNWTVSGSQFFQPPPGMSRYGYKRVTCGNPPMLGERLEEIKLGILHLLATGIMPGVDVICHFIIGSSDSRCRVADYAEAEIKRISSFVDWSNTTLATRLFHIYLGTPGGPPDKTHPIPAANRVTPANTRIRLKTLPFFNRLENSAILFPFNIQVIFDTLHSETSNMKLRTQALNFALANVKRSTDIVFNKIGSILYTGLLKIALNDTESKQIRVASYTVIGQIVKRMPSIVDKNFTDLELLFKNLSSPMSDIRAAVRDALMIMIDAYRLFVRNAEVRTSSHNNTEKMDLDSKDDRAEELNRTNRELADRECMMLEFLSSQLESSALMAREMAVRYLASLFDTNHAQSRYLLLLAVGDQDSDVSSFALKALYTDVEWGEYKQKLIPLPDFQKMAELIYQQAMFRIQSARQCYIIQNVISPFSTVVYIEILTFLRLCLVQSSYVQLTGRENFIHPCEHTPSIRRYILSAHAKNPRIFDYYLSIIDVLLLPDFSAAPIRSLVEVIGTCPELFANRLGPKFQRLMNLLGHTVDNCEDNFAFILSVVAVFTMDEEKLNETTRILLNKIEDENEITQKTAILALGYIVQEKIARFTRNGIQYKAESWPLHRKIFLEIAKNLDDPYLRLISESCTTLSRIMKSAPIPLPDNAPAGFSKYSVLRKLLDIVTNVRLDPEIRKVAIQTCGMMCLGGNFPFAEQLIENLVDISKQTMEVDTHLCIGQSIILCLEGTSSPQKRDLWKMNESDYVKPPLPEANLYLLNTLADELISQVTILHPNLRQAISIFMLSILKKFRYIRSIKNRVLLFQAAFLELSSEENDLIHGIASRGLAFVYEIASPEKKRELVVKLVNQLISGRRTVHLVSRGTRACQDYQFGRASNGGMLCTYKELCFLATELNQPALIYKFIYLANLHMVWISKKDDVFGFHTIAMHTKDELNDCLPELIIRVYRYLFDPTPKIRNAMCSIWNSLVLDAGRVLKQHFREIFADLNKHIKSDQWRVRLSSAAALAELFRGDLSVMDVLDKIPNLMNLLFRIMDGIHEGTRLIATSAATSIANNFTAACNLKKGNIDEQTLQVIGVVFLPGMDSAVPEVRSICLQALSQLIIVAGPTLKPSLPALIVALLKAAGEMKSIGLSYLTVQLKSNVKKKDILDAVRANMTKSHYATKTIAQSIEYIDLDMLNQLVPKVIEVIKTGRLGSRVAAADLILLLTRHFGLAMEKYTKKFLSALLKGLLEKNSTLRKTFASTLGEILHAATPATIKKLMKKLSGWYFEKENVNTRTAIACCLSSAVHYNAELLKDHFPILIPLVFFAMHWRKTSREDKCEALMWENIWNEISLGYEITIPQQFNEILNCLNATLVSLSWSAKAQAGRCIQTIAIKLGEGIDAEHRDELIKFSLRALEGTVFGGKEDIVIALEKLCTLAGPDFKKAPVCQSIVEALLRESGKLKIVYRRQSIEALGNVLETFDNMDFFQMVHELSRSIIRKLDEQMEETDILENINVQKDEKFLTLSALYVCLGKSWPRNKETQLHYQDVLLNECCRALEQNPTDVQLSILTALHYYIDKLHYFSPEDTMTEEGESSLRDILQKITNVLKHCFGNPRHTNLRIEALNIMATIAKKLISTGRDQELMRIAEFLGDSIEELDTDSTPEVQTGLRQVKEILKR